MSDISGDWVLTSHAHFWYPTLLKIASECGTSKFGHMVVVCGKSKLGHHSSLVSLHKDSPQPHHHAYSINWWGAESSLLIINMIFFNLKIIYWFCKWLCRIYLSIPAWRYIQAPGCLRTQEVLRISHCTLKHSVPVLSINVSHFSVVDQLLTFYKVGFSTIICCVAFVHTKPRLKAFMPPLLALLGAVFTIEPISNAISCLPSTSHNETCLYPEENTWWC